MNALDIIILILILLPAIFGLKKGLLKSVFSIAGIILGIILAVKFNSGVSLILKNLIKDPKLVQVISFVSIILLVYFLSVFIASKISKINTLSETFDKIGGFVFGGLKGLLSASILLILLGSYSILPQTQKTNSALYPYVYNAAPSTYNAVKNFIPLSRKDFDDVMNFLKSDTVKSKQ
ncbi:MAG TPA: CvpA family protein [Ignavibacteria bacterium]|nr:CvpA family protein [Ignavibacteria bacterium]